MGKRKKKTGHVAIPFLLAFLFAIVGIGGIAAFLFGKLDDDGGGIQQMVSSSRKPTAEDNFTLLFVLDEPNDHEPLTFMLSRVRPGDKSIMFVTLPQNMLSFVDGRQDTLSGYYKNGGITDVLTAVKNETQITPDRYIILNSEGFQKICNIFGGAYYVVPTGTKGFADSAEAQYLGPPQMEKLLTYPMFDQGEVERSALSADLITSMVNQTNFERVSASMDANFKTLINMMQTDISALDYDDRKSALKYMYKYGSTIAEFRIATGTLDEESNVFILDSGFYDGVREFFEETEETALPEKKTEASDAAKTEE